MIIGTLMALETCLILGQVAREMGSPRQACNRRRRTREGTERACVRAPTKEGGTRRE